ncbi:MAG: heterodisulfide reductase-related iron-sulfur binding cluster [Desulfobacterales bacterium]
MDPALVPPAAYRFFHVPTILFSVLIPLIGLAAFALIMKRRIDPLRKAAPDRRFDRVWERIRHVLMVWLAQWRQPRYMMAGVLHILIFAGFLILSIRSITLVIVGIFPGFVFPGFGGWLGDVYAVTKDYAATWVFLSCLVAGVRRGLFRPERYAVPARYGKDHTWEALFVLALIATLMVSESLFEASLAVAQIQQGQHAEFIAPGTLAWVFKNALMDHPIASLQSLHIGAYFVHDLTFFFFLCFLPMGKHFHVITSLFNVYFMRLDKGTVKPVRHGIKPGELDQLASFGVKRFEDFTWKHILDFYSCADCGRCSDNCPANAVGRPLSPRFISIKGRDYAFANFPILENDVEKPEDYGLIGSVYDPDEIWSCTTCGACEEECPLGIEYIDKIVDLRRGMVDDGNVPQSLQKPLSALEKRGNPWGKMEKKRADWIKGLNGDGSLLRVDEGETAETLFFVDSICSYDDRMQEIARATARILERCGIEAGILGREERDSGNEVRRFGEEMLFQELCAANTEAIAASGARRIVTADPHAFNTLTHDYKGLPPVEHISQVIARGIHQGKLAFSPLTDGKVYTYHDPCYLGRHNGLYDVPRAVLDAIPGLKRVEMLRSRDRSFCCGGGGLMLFYEPEEEQRMGVLRVRMAAKAGADVIVTACPFCLVNMEDAIKVAGLEGRMEAIDLSELVVGQLKG